MVKSSSNTKRGRRNDDSDRLLPGSSSGVPPRVEWDGHVSCLLTILGDEPMARKKKLIHLLTNGEMNEDATAFYKYALEKNGIGDFISTTANSHRSLMRSNRNNESQLSNNTIQKNIENESGVFAVEEIPKRRGRGRPPGSKNKVKRGPQGIKKSCRPTQSSNMAPQDQQQVKRPRGRPRKNSTQEELIVEVQSSQGSLHRNEIGRFRKKMNFRTTKVVLGAKKMSCGCDVDRRRDRSKNKSTRRGIDRCSEAVSAAAVDISDHEFLDQHNDNCQVCGDGGEVLCCSTCNLVFHIQCLRPAVKILPPAGIPGHERGSSLRRKAANYVRIMESKSHKRESQKLILNKAPGKLHEEEKVVATESQHTGSFKYDDDVNEAKKTMNGVGNSLEVGQEELAVAMTSDEDANSDDDKSGSISKSQTMASSSASTSSEEGSSTTKRKYSVITTELCDPASEGVDLTQSRKRRVRHQPVLYDPQLCPASQWQSDATFHFVTKSRPRRKDERLKIFSKDPATYICSFCKNNKSFALCCFCGCRVCFLKDDKNPLSRCTKCGAGYHLRCIDSELKLGACPFCHRHVGNEPIITKKYRDFAPDSRFGGVDSFVILTENDLEGGSGAAFLNTKMQKPKILSSPRGSANSLKTRSSSGKTLRASLPKLPFSPSLEKEDKERDSCPTVTRSGRSVKRKAIFDATAEAEQHLRSPRVGDQGKKARPIAGSEPKKNKVAMECRANDGNASTEETRGYPEHGGKTNCDFPHSSQHVCRHKISASVNLCPNFAQKCEHRGDGNSCSILQHFENSTSNIWSDGKNYGTNDACSSPPSNVFIDSVNSSPFTSIKFDKPAHSLATTCEAPLMAPSDSANDKVIRDMSIKPMAVANKNETGMNDSSNNRRPCQIVEDRAAEPQTASPSVHATSTKTNLHLDSALSVGSNSLGSQPKAPRRKPGARECMQISRRFHTNVIPEKYMNILMDYCTRGKVEHLIRMRERLDEHSRMLESQLAGLEALARENNGAKVDHSISVAITEDCASKSAERRA